MSSVIETADGQDGHTETGIAAPSASAILVDTERRKAGIGFRFALRAAMRVYGAACALARLIGPRPRPASAGYDILLTGTFFSDNWVRSHLEPLAASHHCAKVRMVATVRVPALPKVEGVYPPRWLVGACGTVPARLLYFIWLAIRTRPHIIGGFHLLVNGLVAILMAKLVGARSMYFCVGGPVELLDGGVWGENRIFARLGTPDEVVERELIRAVGACDLVITMGTRAIEFFRGRGLENRFHVVSGGIDSARFHAASAAADFDLVLTCRLVPIKRVDLFLQTVQAVSRHLPNVRAVIVGDGPLRTQMEAAARDLGITSNVTFAGQQDNVEDWLRRSRVFMLTSDSEGLSLALIEAMMTGLPAVVSKVGDLPDLVEDGVNGFLVAERTAEAFAAPLLGLLTNPAAHARFSAAAHAAASRYAPVAVTAQWDQILDTLEPSPREHPQGAVALSRKNLWERCPAPLKRVAGPVLERIPPGALLGAHFRRQRSFIERAQWWSAERSREYQTLRLRELCTHASQRSPYYRELFQAAHFDPRDLRGPEDLDGIPLLDRETLRDRLAELCATNVVAGNVDYVSTGGSTGGPLWFYINSERSSFDYAHLTAGWARVGFTLGTPLAVLRGRVIQPDADGLYHEYDPLLRHHYYSSFHLNSDKLARDVRHIRSIGPCFIHAYPSSVAALERYMRSAGEPPLVNLRGVLVESEAVFDEDRERAKATLGCPYFSSYGLTEKVVAAAACEQSDAYHVWPTYGYLELLDEAGRRITTPGERGEIVGTGFVNTAVPFIRYRTGDYATLAGHSCPQCRREHVLLTDIRGRRPQEWLVAADGALISWTALNMHDDTFRNVLRFQFEQHSAGRATLKIVPSEHFGRADADRILHNLNRKLDGAVTLEIAIVDTIRLSDAGKTIYIDQRLPIQS